MKVEVRAAMKYTGVWSTFLAKCEMISMDYVCVCSSGPGQYNLSVKSCSPMALISREDRFKEYVDTNPGPGAYQVNTLLKCYCRETFLPPSLHDSTSSQHAVTSVRPLVLMCLHMTESECTTRPCLCVCSIAREATNICLTLSRVLILRESIKFLPLTLRRAEGN